MLFMALLSNTSFKHLFSSTFSLLVACALPMVLTATSIVILVSKFFITVLMFSLSIETIFVSPSMISACQSSDVLAMMAIMRQKGMESQIKRGFEYTLDAV